MPVTRAHGITIGPDDAVYCSDDLDHTMRKFTTEGKLLLTLGTSGKPSDTGIDGIDYRTADSEFDRIFQFRKVQNKFPRRLILSPLYFDLIFRDSAAHPDTDQKAPDEEYSISESDQSTSDPIDEPRQQEVLIRGSFKQDPPN